MASGNDGPGQATSPSDVLARLQGNRVVIQEYRRIPESIEWDLSRSYFRSQGSKVFGASDHIPFEITSNGNLSRWAAEVLWSSLEGAPEGDSEPIHVMELGAGSGLFARFFLDAFQSLSAARGSDAYSRLTYWVTDGSPKMVQDLEAGPLLSAHKERCRLLTVDAGDPVAGLRKLVPARLPSFDAVFLNYILDVLPTTALERSGHQVRELFVQTCLARGVKLEDYGLTAAELSARVQSNDLSALDGLLPLHPILALEYCYRPVEPAEIPYKDFALRHIADNGGHLLLNYGAFGCLESLKEVLHPRGFILVNDYGRTMPDQGRENNVYQRFSGSVASQLDFTVLTTFCREECHLEVIEPEGDSDLIRSRLITLPGNPQSRSAFRRHFGKAEVERIYERTTTARRTAQEGMLEQALAEYNTAMREQPYHWALADEVAQFLMGAFRDFAAARQIAEHGLSLNPTCSASLWCTLGDCLLNLKDMSAEACYGKALAIDDKSARAHFGIALCRQEHRDSGAALLSLAKALSYDKQGTYRERILAKQIDILKSAGQRWEQERKNAVNRVGRSIAMETAPADTSGRSPETPREPAERGADASMPPAVVTGNTRRKLILRNFQSPGDIVMLTAAVRDLHKCYPDRFLTDVRTPCPHLWENNPYLTPLKEGDSGVEVIECRYPLIHESNHAPFHFIHGFIAFLNQELGLQIRPTLFRGDIHLSEKERSWTSQVEELTENGAPFWLVTSGGKHDFTIKWWDPERYQRVIDHFRGRIQFVQVGEGQHHHPALRGAIDLRGKTDLRQLIRLVYHAQGVLCPVNVLMHLAAAVEVKGGRPKNRPCVVIAGGREPSNWEMYPHHQYIHTNGALVCCDNGGCWKSRTKPLGDGDEKDRPENLCVDVVGTLPRCMDMITADDVIRRMEFYFKGGAVSYMPNEEGSVPKVRGGNGSRKAKNPTPPAKTR